MGCGATKLEPTEEPAPEGQSDKMKFRQATVIDLLAAENEENDRILLKWAGKVFDQFDADHNGRLVHACCVNTHLVRSLLLLPKLLYLMCLMPCKGFQGAGQCAQEVAEDKTCQFAAGQTFARVPRLMSDSASERRPHECRHWFANFNGARLFRSTGYENDDRRAAHNYS